ncbi:MAG: hypothetical protein QM503_12810 [Bacteroidota bacterium]
MFKSIQQLTFALLLLSFFLSKSVIAQWNPHAGLIESYTSNAVIYVSSGANKSAIVDFDMQSYWESTSPLPSNYITNKDLNIFLNKNKYELGSSNTNLGNVFDGISSSKASVNNSDIEIRFIKPQHLFLLSVKINTTDTVIITVVTTKNIIKFKYSPSENYSLKAIEFPLTAKIKSIRLESDASFDVFEIAGLYELPTEEVTFDFTQTKDIGWISSRHFNGAGISSILVLVSDNNLNWQQIATLNPISTAYIPLQIIPQISAQYLKVVFVLMPRAYQKAKLLEFNVYNKFGPFGEPQAAQPSAYSYSQSFGINAIWGWGYSVYSDQLTGETGAELYGKVARLARNYHSINWDISKPGKNPNYQNMQLGNGTSATSWLNWDREYSIWKSSGFSIDACIMFNNKNFSDSLWHNTIKESNDYGGYFANHFSKSTSLISLVEIGNEPWAYSKPVYRNILAGMSNGLSKNAKNLTILSCAIQAYAPNIVLDNYIADYIEASNSSNIDGLNTHLYSYVFNENGGQSAVNPEDRRSEVWSIANLQRFSSANMDGKPVYVTEFGYDSDGGGDDCTHDVCITEFEQAIYGTRMALILYRLGVRQFYWYYFANVDYNSMKHNRSGLTSSYSKGMQQKESFKAFELLQNTIGNYYFHHIIMENDNAFVYAFSDSSGKIMRIIAWKPTSENHNSSEWISFPFSNVIDKVIPLASSNQTGKVSYVKGANELKISLSGIPVVIIIKN